ncbi:lysosomal amino acid transporter 1 homolog isoform X2 [Cygnus olor]|uniref:lysosomal amino acid transporter 1 homolog isoform X2 n=1 Tax=Cygnus atratus TaxID=8868 RepID=UPI0015D63AA7|nr:lysosomal amino acid transporter 1 homolog isoform X2 [Cygnus atratus]XP_040422954.1 lysosomal amino acid transporter 1 homolog isoform X2 [Cygnus olor]
MRLEITAISSIRLDAEVFSQRIFSIGKQICGFAWGKNGGRNKLLKLNLSPEMMASQLYTHAFNISPIETRRLCINGTPWIWHLLEECVENAWEYWSVVIGLISIVCFLFAALPQIYVACQNGKVDQALSLGFLLCWIAGDLTNFIGCYLTNQLPIQTITAISYVNMDIIMISQYVYYKLKNQKMTKCSKNLKNFCVTWILLCIALCIVLLCQLLIRNQDQSSVLERSNFRRRSTEGTSYLLFALAMLGNCTYGLSLVLKMPATKSFQALYFLHHLPWLIGSFGVLFLDILVTVQFVLYRQHEERQPGVVALEVEPLLLGEETA